MNTKPKLPGLPDLGVFVLGCFALRGLGATEIGRGMELQAQG